MEIAKNTYSMFEMLRPIENDYAIQEESRRLAESEAKAWTPAKLQYFAHFLLSTAMLCQLWMDSVILAQFSKCANNDIHAD